MPDTATEYEVFAVDDGPMATAMLSTVEGLLGSKVTTTQRESMVPGRLVIEFQADTENVMLAGWSDGEVMVWKFCQSLAGRTGINLDLLARTVGGQTEITNRLVALFALSLDRSA